MVFKNKKKFSVDNKIDSMINILHIPSNFPKELIYNILTYDNRFVIQKDKIIIILSIPKTDKRYLLLKEIPEKQIYPWWSCVELWLSYDDINDADNYYVIHYEIMEEENCYVCNVDKKIVLRKKPDIYLYRHIGKNEIIIY
jgi:hypothetical protein